MLLSYYLTRLCLLYGKPIAIDLPCLPDLEPCSADLTSPNYGLQVALRPLPFFGAAHCL